MSKRERQPIEYFDSVVELITKVVDDKTTHSHRVFNSVINNVKSLVPDGGYNEESKMPAVHKEGIIEFISILITMHRVNTHYLGNNYNNRTDHILHKTVAVFLRYFIGDLERVNLIGSCPLEHTYNFILDRVGCTNKDFTELSTEYNTLSDYVGRYWNTYHKGLTRRFGVVYTPHEVVDFTIRSAADITPFNRGITILDPFNGAGLWLMRLLEIGVIANDDLEYKYRNDIFGNEIMLYSFYVGVMNISNTYELVTGRYETFQNLRLCDTFQLHEDPSKPITVTLPAPKQQELF